MAFQLRPVRKQPPAHLIPYLARWQSNNDPNDLGIVRFAFECFPETFKREFGTAGWVRPALATVLEYKSGMRKIDRCHAVCTYRDGSKSTWFGKILPLYFLLVGQYGIYWKDELLPETDYIRLRGKTQEKAEEKLTNIAKELTNPIVLELFGDLQPSFQEVKNKKMKNQAKLMILRNGYILQAQGLNMPSRGANIFDKRPKLDIDDDVENKENTKTAQQRIYNAKEILGEQLGGLADDGMTIYIGNYVHEECLMAKLLHNDGWKRQYYQITRIDPETKQEIADWPQRFPVEYVHKLGNWYEKHPDIGGWAIFRLEYYNEIVSDKAYIVKYTEMEYERVNGVNWVKFKDELGQEQKVNANIVVSLDPAISTANSSSDGVVTVTAFCADNKRRVLDVSLGKFDIRDRFINPNIKPKVLARTPTELANVVRKGSVDELCRKVLQYNAEAWVIENAGQQLAWFNDAKDILTELKINVPGMPYHPKDEKVYKLETGLMGYWATGLYEINKALVYVNQQIEPIGVQVRTFPNNKMDILDALHNGEKMGRVPEVISYSPLNNYRQTGTYPSEVPLTEGEAWICF